MTYLICDELVGSDCLFLGCLSHGGMPHLGFRTPLRLDLAGVGQALNVAIDPSLQRRVDKRHRHAWAEVRLELAVDADESRAALDEVRRHYKGKMTPRLSRLADQLAPQPLRALASRRARGRPRSMLGPLRRRRRRRAAGRN
jgi:hypothetical protein